ncbi:MYXO-CTERM sorting domain-containing protein [Myxococcota bacterium]|nr:MYXO-CTERM sorting domain-containing protein [Myxococcota bacterium]
MTSSSAERRAVASLAAACLLAAASPSVAGPPPALDLKWSASLMHFNLQYCAGGLEGFADAMGLDFGDDYDASEQGVEDQIVRESFVPVLEILERHPDWAFDIEMQGLMVDVLRERFPDVLDRLRALADQGRVELVSFHYSAQLYVAWPERDLDESLGDTARAFQEADLPLSGVVFAQEGQWSPGQTRLMGRRGYDLALLPKNLFSYFHPEIAPEPWYRLDGVDVLLAGRGIDAADGQVKLHWTWFDDGELLATQDLNCYLGPAFVRSEESIAEYEAKVEQDASQGYVVGTVSGFRDALAAAGVVAAVDLPPTPDGTWQPSDTDNVALWMGGMGIFQDTEDDAGVLTGIADARALLLAAEVLAAGAPPDSGRSASLAEAWRELSLAQVSDATGWNPFATEVDYSHRHAEATSALAADVAATALRDLGVAPGTEVDVDASIGTYSEAPADGTAGEWIDVEEGGGPLAVEVVAAGREARTVWQRHGQREGLHRVHVDLGVPAGGERTATVRFPLSLDELAWSPALAEDRVDRVPLADLAGGGDFTVPLANGLIGLADDLWLVADTRTVHAAGWVSGTSGAVAFDDETLPAAGAVRWTFLVLAGPEGDAIALADATNVRPTVRIAASLAPEAPPGDGGDPPPEEEAGCGCSASGTSGPAGWPLVAAAVAAASARRRRDENGARGPSTRDAGTGRS